MASSSNNDRLSTLPADMRCQIMSLLPTLDAARLGLLSRPLRRSYNSLSSLFFDNILFPNTRDKPYSFVNFILRTVGRHDDSDVTTMEVRCWPNIDCDVPIRAEWITFAVMHRVQKLILFGVFNDVRLPECLLTCGTLVKLELTLKDYLLTSENFALPNLRKLRLKKMTFGEEFMGSALFRNLPALKKLSVLYCELPHGDLSISSDSLEEFVFCDPRLDECSLKLHTPRLSRFIYITSDEQTSDFDVYRPGRMLRMLFFISGGNVAVVNGSINQLVPLLIKVTKDLFIGSYLPLGYWLIEYLSMAHNLLKQATFCQFHGILAMDIEIWPIMDHLIVLIMLISKCPNLKQVDIELKTPQREAVQLLSEDSLAEHVTTSGFRSVQVIEIHNFVGGETQLMLVRFLLANMVELGGMRIVLGDLMGRERRMTIFEILEYERASEIVSFG